MPSTVCISRRGEDRLRAGHVWVYRSDVTAVDAEGGDTVRVVNTAGRPVGHALYSDRSEITLRFLTRHDEPADLGLWRARLRSAIAYREGLAIDATACRLVHGEADLLPSLIVDRYGDYLAVQALSQAVDRLLPDICGLLVELTAPRGILARNDPRVRVLEGLERRVDVVHGQVPETCVVREGPIEYDVDLWNGQKTGFFLDQRENREAAVHYAGGRLLDCFSYTGAFALRLAAACTEVIAVEISNSAVERLVRHAARNRLSVTTRMANAFDVLAEMNRAGERFDTIVLDPPAFAKNKRAIAKALSGYKEINLRALKMLSPGGHLLTCSCSYQIDEARFAQMLYEASIDAHVRIAVIEKRMQSRDHPVILGIPETYYLKCFIVRRLE